MVIFHSYVSLPEGIFWEKWKIIKTKDFLCGLPRIDHVKLQKWHILFEWNFDYHLTHLFGNSLWEFNTLLLKITS
jgi:hypothetical protein